MRLVRAILTVFGLILSTVPADAAGRVALVVGNDDYAYLPKLRNAVNDARALDARLRELGFETILKLDATERDLNRAIHEFAVGCSRAEWGWCFTPGTGSSRMAGTT